MSFDDVLAQMQAEVANPTKNAQNTHLKNKYADLESVKAVTDPILAKYKGTIKTGPESHQGGVQTFISKVSVVDPADGQRYTDSMTFDMPLQKSDPQGLGSAITYARRYALVCWFDIVQTDDDGNAASGVGRKPAAPKPAKTSDLNAARVIKAFEEATEASGFAAATALFTKLDPAEQAAVIPSATAARARTGVAK